MRDLAKVIEAIVKQVPSDFADKDAFLEKMKKTKSSVEFVDPKVIPLLWQAVEYHLNEHLGEPDADWKKTIEGIITGRLDYVEYL